ncbi:MAG: hypothetical protein KatS3mg105_3925 [Gemmatales bacterium]|nr:MAG: hypothetical protein KatS3mg105_3925 [Gemmatales bacterium]
MLIEGGGNAASEAAVARGLKWLARHQAPDGRWSLNDFAQHGRCNCTGPGSSHCDVAATAFGLLPMLGAGQTHKGGADKGNLYTKTVENGLKFLLLQQARNGAFDPNHHHEMYAHGLATIAVCEAYGMTSDPALRYSAQRALNYIVQAQTPIGGWDYRPQKKPIYDGSITAWQLMALKSGQMAGLTVPIETLKRAMKALDEAATSDGGRYGYRSRHPENGFRPGTTAGGLMCRLYLGWGPRNPGLLSGLRYLRSYGPRTNNMYYSYYACQVMHNIGGAYWKEWNPKMRDGLIAAQDKGEKNPHQAGSWYDPSDHISSGKGGRVMQTSLSLFALEVYYRHLPLYQRISEDKELTQR